MFPRIFPGTPEQAAANYDTHQFGDEGRCWNCDCRPWGLWASWPCNVTEDEMIAAGGVLPEPEAHARAFIAGFGVQAALTDYEQNW